jgi:hypothetical protein
MLPDKADLTNIKGQAFYHRDLEEHEELRKSGFLY